MAASSPDSADVHPDPEPAAKSADPARTPLLAALGAGDYAVSAVTKAVADARSRAADARGKAGEQAGQVQNRLAELPQRMSGDELRKLLEDLRAQAEKVYAEFAERGEQAWDQLRNRPQLQQAVTSLKTYTDKLDAHVDTLVGEARDAGGRVVRTTQRFSAQAARGAGSAGQQAGDTVAEQAERVAEAVEPSTPVKPTVVPPLASEAPATEAPKAVD